MYSMECQGVLETTSGSAEIINVGWGVWSLHIYTRSVTSHVRACTRDIYVSLTCSHVVAHDSVCTNKLDILVNVISHVKHKVNSGASRYWTLDAVPEIRNIFVKKMRDPVYYFGSVVIVVIVKNLDNIISIFRTERRYYISPVQLWCVL